jgi:hypothetical protein
MNVFFVLVSSYVLLLLQVVIFESRVKTPQVGLYALAKALTQKGVAKKIQVPVLTLSVSSVKDVYGSLVSSTHTH